MRDAGLYFSKRTAFGSLCIAFADAGTVLPWQSLAWMLVGIGVCTLGGASWTVLRLKVSGTGPVMTLLEWLSYSDAVALFGTDLNAAEMNTIVGYVYDMLYGTRKSPD